MMADLDFTPRNDREMAMLVAYIGGATTDEIAGEFGISGQRVRQLCARMGLSVSAKHALGVKDFGRKGRYSWQRFDRAMETRRRVRENGRQRRRLHLSILKQLNESLGRAPTLSEFCVALGYAPNGKAAAPLSYWTGRTYYRNYKNATTRLYRLAGIARPLMGGSGHVRHRR